MPALYLLLATLWTALAVPAPDAPRVYVGVHLNDVSGFDLKDGRFRADLQLWCKWLSAPSASGEPVAVPPISLGNAEVDEMTLVARESDGDWHSARWRVQGTFRGTFPLHDFPRDKQHLTIEVDLPEERGVLLPDLAGSGMVDTFSITGWLYERWFEAHTGARVFHTDFGSIQHEGQARRAHTVSFVLSLTRPLAPYIVKFLLPLYIILGACALTFAVRPRELEVRAGVATSCLLSCVAFHFTQADSLPAVPYMVTADQLFLGSYVLVLFALGVTVAGHRIHERSPARTTRLDRFGAAAFITLAAGLGVFCFAKPAHEAPELDIVAHAAELDTAPVAESPRDTLTITMGSLNGLSTHAIGDGLLRRGLVHVGRDGRRQPFLAEEVPDLTNHLVRFDADGGMTVRWRLREGLRWGDGHPISAADLVFSLGLDDDPERASVTRVDDRTVDVHYTDRRFDSLQPVALLPAHSLAAVAEAGGTDAVWTALSQEPPPLDGPYVLESFDKGSTAVLVRNPHFAGPRPAIAKLRITKVDRPLVEILADGEAQLAPLVSDQSLRLISELAAFEERRDPSEFQFFLQPDLTQPPFDDLRVRRAVSHAIDRDAVARALFGEVGRPAWSYRPVHAADHAGDVRRYDGGAEASRALLREAGLSLPVPVRLRAMARPAGTNDAAGFQAVVASLEAGGFAVTVDLHDGSVLRDYLGGDHGGLLFYSRRHARHGNYWNVPYLDNAFQMDAPARAFDDGAAALYAAWSHTLYPERRRAISQQLQRRWAEVVPVVPLAWGPVGSAHADTLSGWAPDAGAETVWWNVESWSLAADDAG